MAKAQRHDPLQMKLRLVRKVSTAVPPCHPRRPYYARQQCIECYQRTWAKTVKGRKGIARRQKRYLQRKRAAGVIMHARMKISPAIANITACQICTSTKRLVFDHEHGTRHARGRLCDACNRSLGFIEHASKRGLLPAFLRYLETA